jgi:glycosyltransferase involved in cell wall biosynthesis
MNIFKRYIDLQNDQYTRCLDQPGTCISFFVVIPCFNEPDILTTLNSLADCYPPDANVSVLVVINSPDDADDEIIVQNISSLNSIGQWQLQHHDLFFKVQRIFAHDLPNKWAGVGWARKIGMDEAVRQIFNNNYPDGIIVSLDADSTVTPDYFKAVEKAFIENPQFGFCTIYFEHIYDNQELSDAIREGIIRYELHMRYYRKALEWIGYPHAIHTIGSGFALKASAYVKQGGMNRRKAGEDFYFLHKLVLLGDYGTIDSTTVFPSARESGRVPFGTGAAMKKWLGGSTELNYSYSLEAFCYLKPLFTHPMMFWDLNPPDIIEVFENLHPSLQTFCRNSQIVDKMLILKDNCSNAKVFEKRFFHLFNAFWILKYLNSVRETTNDRALLLTETVQLLNYFGVKTENNNSPENLLSIFRNLDKKKGLLI